MIELWQKQKRIAVYVFMNKDTPLDVQEKYMRRCSELRMQIRANKGIA